MSLKHPENLTYNFSFNFNEVGNYWIGLCDGSSAIMEVYDPSNLSARIDSLNISIGNITEYPDLRTAIATGTTYKEGERIKTLTACLDANNRPANSTAKVTIYYPNNSIWINNESMTEIETGLFNYSSYAPHVRGIYLIKSTCYSGNSTATSISEMQVPEWVEGIVDYNSPIITVISPANNTNQTTSNLVNFTITTNEIATCYVYINGTGYSLNSNSTTHSNILAVNNGNYFTYFNCSDSSGNVNSTSNNTLNVNYVISTETSNGGGGGGFISLTDINLTYTPKNGGFIVHVQTLDRNGEKTEINELNFSLLENISYELTIERIGIGEYQGVFNLGKTNLTEFNVNVRIDDGGYILTDSIKTTTVEETILNVLTGWVTSGTINSDSWIRENKVLFWVILIMGFLGFVGLTYLVYHLKKGKV
jgi:hypothetical protein